MSINLLAMVKNYFTSEFTNHASSNLGENTTGISKALTAIIPIGLAGILNKSTSGTEGANEVYEKAKNSVNTISGTPNLTSNENVEKGNNMALSLFGTRQTPINGAVASFSGIKESSSSTLMSMALPAIMGLLGKHTEQNNLSASGLAGFLSSQKDHIIQAMPAGLTSVGGMLGLESIGSAAQTVSPNVKSTDANSPIDEVHTISETPTAKWLVPLIVILIVLAALWYFSTCNQTKPSPATNIDSTGMIQNATNQSFIFPTTKTGNVFVLNV